MAGRYEEGATVYELAADFGFNRTTVAALLKKAGTFAGTFAGTVLRYLSDHGVKTRDAYGRERHPYSPMCEESLRVS